MWRLIVHRRLQNRVDAERKVREYGDEFPYIIQESGTAILNHYQNQTSSRFNVRRDSQFLQRAELCSRRTAIN